MDFNRISYFFEYKFGNFIFSFGHPMKPIRANMVFELIKSYGLDKWLNIKKGRCISLEEMSNFHLEEHLVKLFNFSHFNYKNDVGFFFPKNKGLDCPIFLGLTEFVNLYTKASVSGAQELSNTNAKIAINWSGGFHHAKYNEMSGFCYINDIVISILELLKNFKRVLYIDIDAHHGDGVEEAFYLSKRVVCLSFHNYQKFFFPETGCQKNKGILKGRGFSFNFPNKPGLKDQPFYCIFRPIVEEILVKFSPNVIVFQSGADSLSKDPLGKYNLSIKGHGKCLEFLKNLDLPILVLGGGGYKISNVSRCWTYETSVLLEKKISNKIPFNIYWQRYQGFFKLNFKISNNQDKNTKKNLLNLRKIIIKNVRKIKINN